MMIGAWEPLDPVTPEQWEEDRDELPTQPSPYAANVILSSGRSYHWTGDLPMPQPLNGNEAAGLMIIVAIFVILLLLGAAIFALGRVTA